MTTGQERDPRRGVVLSHPPDSPVKDLVTVHNAERESRMMRTSRFTSDRMVAILRQEREQVPAVAPALRTPEIAERRVYYGRRRIRVLLRREGWRVNHKRVP